MANPETLEKAEETLTSIADTLASVVGRLRGGVMSVSDTDMLQIYYEVEGCSMKLFPPAVAGSLFQCQAYGSPEAKESIYNNLVELLSVTHDNRLDILNDIMRLSSEIKF